MGVSCFRNRCLLRKLLKFHIKRKCAMKCPHVLRSVVITCKSIWWIHEHALKVIVSQVLVDLIDIWTKASSVWCGIQREWDAMIWYKRPFKLAYLYTDFIYPFSSVIACLSLMASIIKFKVRQRVKKTIHGMVSLHAPIIVITFGYNLQ